MPEGLGRIELGYDLFILSPLISWAFSWRNRESHGADSLKLQTTSSPLQ
jgi:hypothetical protein